MTDTFKKKQLEFFDSRTPEDPAYWSTEIFDIYDENYDKVISKRGQAELKRLEAMEWQDVIREYVRWWIKGETFTAQEVDDICCKKVPDSLHFITQGISEVLYHKYGLLPTLLEDQFSPEDIIKTHVHWIHDNYNMPIDKELQALIDKYHVTLREPTVFK